MSKILDQIEKLKKLVTEYQKSSEAENQSYHLIKDLGTAPAVRYFFIHRETGKILSYGPAKRIKSYMNLRNIRWSSIVIDDNINLKKLCNELL